MRRSHIPVRTLSAWRPCQRVQRHTDHRLNRLECGRPAWHEWVVRNEQHLNWAICENCLDAVNKDWRRLVLGLPKQRPPNMVTRE